MKFETIFNAQGDNLAEQLTEEELGKISASVHQGYKDDRTSRRGWEAQNAEGLKLALQLKEDKSFPWEHSANVKVPLVAMSCVQYNARAYSALIGNDDLVKPVNGGEEAFRVTKQTSNYIRHEMEDWEQNHDQMLIMQALTGCPVKKTHKGYENVKSEVILPDRIVVNYFSGNKPERLTHRIYYSENEIKELQLSGFFRECELQAVNPESTPTTDVSDKAHGEVKTANPEGHEILEVHCLWDMDGDGLKEPYIIHIDDDSGKILRISTRWESIRMAKKGKMIEGYDAGLEKAGYKVCKITPETFFTKYEFIPSPDGSWYGIGFGSLLGPINKAVDSLLNQLIDAGTLATVSGGMLARNVRVRSGKVGVIPGKWVRTEANAQDLAKGVFPWPTKEPSSVLFALMQFLMQMGERLGSVTEAMTGENPGQNQAATTTMAVLEQGSQVHNSIYKRTFRAMTNEMRLIYKFLSQENREVYNIDPKDIMLTADPTVMSQSQRIAKVQALKEAAAMQPNLYGFESIKKIESMWLEALQIAGGNELLAEAQPAGGDPKMAIEQEKLKLDQWRAQQDNEIQEARVKLESLNTISNTEKRLAEIDKINSEIGQGEAKVLIEKQRENLNSVKQEAESILKVYSAASDDRAQKQDMMSQAQAAIEQGADPQAVSQRMSEIGGPNGDV